MLLLIDTTDREEVRLALVDKQISSHNFKTTSLSEALLPEIKKFFKKQKISFEQLTKIAVVVGMGGFSRIRTAVATANALAFSLNILVTAVEKSKFPHDLKKLVASRGQKMIAPKYSAQPNITLPKKH